MKKLDPQILITITVMLISFMALFVSIRQTSIMHEQTALLFEQNKASAWPYLDIGLRRSFSRSAEGESKISGYEIVINNQGTGPAIVKGVRLLCDGVPVRNWGEYYKEVNVPDSIRLGHSNGHISNKVVTANSEVMLINFEYNKELMSWMYLNGHKMTLEICFKSVFDDYWIARRVGFKTNLETSDVEEAEGCTFNTEELFIE